MANLTRLSFSIERSLEKKLDDLVRRAGDWLLATTPNP